MKESKISGRILTHSGEGEVIQLFVIFQILILHITPKHYLFHYFYKYNKKMYFGPLIFPLYFHMSKNGPLMQNVHQFIITKISVLISKTISKVRNKTYNNKTHNKISLNVFH